MQDKIVVTAPGRIDLSAGPTDWCGMNTLAMAINLRAKATVSKLEDPNLIRIEIDNEKIDYYEPEYDGKLDLFKAVIELTGFKGISVQYETEIPKGSGLGGSAPLTVSTVMALSKLFNTNWNRYYIAELAQRAETYKLHTVNGYQDQYAATFGGLLFMNFDGKSCQIGNYSKTVEEEPYSTVEDLTQYCPDFHIVLAVPEITRLGSGQTNGSLSDRYLNNEEEIVVNIQKMAKLAKYAKKAVVNQDLDRLYEIINEDNDILRIFGFVSEKNEEIITAAKNAGAIACKTCGAGRGAVALFAPDEMTRDMIFDSVKPLVPFVFKTHIDNGARYEL